MSAAIKLFEFEGARLRTFCFRGRPCWIAQEVGAALGYTEAGFRRALENWADELLDGSDVQTLRGAELREFKAVAEVSAELALTSVGRLAVLYESGIDVVCLKTDKPLGRRLRRFMADVVMPGLRRGTLDMSATEIELVRVSLALEAHRDQTTVWERDTIRELCRLYGQPAWDGSGRMPFWLSEPFGRVYRIVLGDTVYKALKERNPQPQRGSLHYQWLGKDRHGVMQDRDMAKVATTAQISRTKEEFFERLRFLYRRTTMLQLAW